MLPLITSLDYTLCRLIDTAEKDAHTGNLFGDDAWTRLIKERLGELGEQLGHKVCSSGFKDWFDPEWLLDLVWYNEDAEGLLIDVPLAVESEWNEAPHQIKLDFEKLLAIRACNRLMICTNRPKHHERNLGYFRKAVVAYRHRQPGDRYLIALYNPNTETFTFELIVLVTADEVQSVPVLLDPSEP